jgi:predicted SprT family Zn-dependent metalloprotease
MNLKNSNGGVTNREDSRARRIAGKADLLQSKPFVSYDTKAMKTEPLTPAEYQAFEQAYDFFNAELFGHSLPHVLVTLQRHAKAYGYFSPERFIGRAEEEAAHELAMNPDHFGRTDEEILSTLVHEMVHVWQKEHGSMPRRGYHNWQWADKMKEVGLYPSHTHEPGGKETGQSMGHYIIKGAPFAMAFAKLQATGFELRWQSQTPAKDPTRKKKRASKTKYTCPDCGQNAWAKPDALLICGQSYKNDGDICHMLAEQSDETKAA